MVMTYPAFIENNRNFPGFYKIRMNYPHHCIPDMDAAMSYAVHTALKQVRIKKGDRVAVCVGSRGIPGIALMVKRLCSDFRERGAVPYIIPAMGSHGGANSQGQIDVLESLGVTSDFVEQKYGHPWMLLK